MFRAAIAAPARLRIERFVLTPSIDAAIVLEFHPDRSSDIAALRFLATSISMRIVAVAQRLHPERRLEIERDFGDANVAIYSVGAAFGRGSAIRLGLNKVHEEFVAILNLEDRVEPSEIVAMVRQLANRPRTDAVITYRNEAASFSNRTRRHWRSCAYSAFVNAMFRLDVRDVQSPLKCYRMSALRTLLDDLQLFDHGFDTDLLFHTRRRGFNVLQLPTRSTRSARRWPLISTAVHAAISIVVLRLSHSPLGRNHVVRLLGRPVILPKKEQYSILIFCWRDPLSPKAGGSEVYLYEQARCWIASGHRVTWVAQRYRGASRRETFDGILIERHGRSLFVFAAAILWYVLRSGCRYDFIIDTMNGIPFFTPIFSRKPKICLLHHLHEMHFRDELPPLFASLAVALETRLVPYVYRRTPFVTVSESSALEMQTKRITQLPIQIIHNGVSAEYVGGTKHPAPTILFIGRLRRYKRLRSLIDAFTELKREILDARLVIAGTGDDAAALRAYAADRPGVTFLGRVDDATKIRLMQEAWVFGMPSSFEGWGIVVIEAASCATPSVAFDVNGLRDCIIDGTTGLLAKSQREFTELLGYVLLDRDLRERLSRNAREWSENFSWSATAERTLARIRDAQPWNDVFESVARDEVVRYRNVPTRTIS